MFKNPFSFDGRIRRTEFGLSLIIYAVTIGIINVMVEQSSGDAAFLLIALIPLLWFLWAQCAKRCHDVGNSGWWQLIPFYIFWLIFQDGQPSKNEYGENPKGIQVLGGQTYQGNSNNQPQVNSNPHLNPGAGYQGDYSGGHNNHNANFKQVEQESQKTGYIDGSLYD